MNNPKSQIEEVLYYLIKNDSITRRQLFFDTGILSPSARIGELRNKHGLEIICESKSVNNKFGRKVKYGVWSLENKSDGIIVYKELQESKIYSIN